MKWFLFAVSLAWIVVGSCSILYTDEFRQSMRQMFEEMDRRVLAVLPFMAGLLFLWAAPASRNAWFIRLLGITAMIKGGFIFANPNNLYEKITDWYLNSASDQTYRFYGIMALILGTAVLSWIL